MNSVIYSVMGDYR